MERKISELKKIKTRNYQRLNKLQNAKKKTQRSSSKIVISEAFQRVTDETLQESHLTLSRRMGLYVPRNVPFFKLNIN